MADATRAAALPGELFARFARRCERALAELPTPGLNVAVAVDDAVAWSHAAGLAQYGPDQALTPRHLHRIGSITKLFTAHAVLLLRDAGALDLDDELGRWVPEFRPSRRPPVTLRHVLCHGSGISNEGGRDVWGAGVFPDAAEFRRWIAEFEPVAPPLVHLKYSNAAYSMLGLIVEAASGMPYERFVAERLLAPLAMADTAFHLSDDQRERFAHGHAMPPDQQRFERTAQQELRAFSACGMLASTPADVLRLAILQWSNSPLLPTATRDEMHRLHLIDASVPGWRTGYGLGWRLDRHGKRIDAGHGGSYLGNRCYLPLSLPDRVAVAVFANRGQALGADALAVELLTATLEALGPPPGPRPNAEPLPEPVRALLGRYAKPHWYELLIHHTSDGLRLRMGRDDGPGVRLEPLGSDRYRIAEGRYVGEELRVVGRSASGWVEAITMAGGRLERI